jgi:hypothetical protein
MKERGNGKCFLSERCIIIIRGESKQYLVLGADASGVGSVHVAWRYSVDLG